MIAVSGLTKIYEGNVKALDEVSFEIPSGKICGYVGTNGAGKSTTVRILCGILGFDSGSASLCGIDLVKDKNEVKRISGYVPETANLFESLTPLEFFEFIGKVRQLDASVIRRRSDNFSELFDYSEMLNESIGTLSKGNKQKILITSALIHNPHVIFLDEPLNGLDANAIYRFQDLIRYFASTGKTILYCSHLLDTLEKISDKLIVLDNGKVRLDSTISDFRKSADNASLEDLFKSFREESDTKKISYEGLFA